MRNLSRVLVAVLCLWAAPAAAQVAIPNTFVAQTRIQSALVNENFSELGAKACNRTGCTMTGTFTSLTLLPFIHDTYALGSSGVRYSNVFGVLGNYSGLLTLGAGATITGNVVVSGTVDGVDLSAWLDQSVKAAATPAFAGLSITGGASTFTIAGTGAASFDTAGGAQFGSGNVSLIDITGKITAISSTYFASLDGTNLTGLAKLASTNTFTGRNDLKGYTETKSTSNPSAAAITYDLSTGTHFETALTGNATVTISNVPNPSNGVVAFTIKFTADGTLRTFTWPGSVVWSSGSAMVFTSTNNKRDFVTFISYDAGTTWFGFIGGQNY